MFRIWKVREKRVSRIACGSVDCTTAMICLLTNMDVEEAGFEHDGIKKSLR